MVRSRGNQDKRVTCAVARLWIETISWTKMQMTKTLLMIMMIIVKPSRCVVWRFVCLRRFSDNKSMAAVEATWAEYSNEFAINLGATDTRLAKAPWTKMADKVHGQSLKLSVKQESRSNRPTSVQTSELSANTLTIRGLLAEKRQKRQKRHKTARHALPVRLASNYDRSRVSRTRRISRYPHSIYPSLSLSLSLSLSIAPLTRSVTSSSVIKN
jgi:hypothetical protein